MTPEQRQAARARCDAATYDLMHTCLDYCFCDPPGRCYHGDTDEMCRYEPRCHDQHQDRMGIRPRLVQPAVLLSDITLALDEIDRLEAERDALAAEGRLLLAAVKACERDNCSVCPFTYNELCGCRVEDVHTETGDLHLAPLITAEAERVKGLDAEIERLKTSPFIAAIADERQRQLDNEGWTPKHDADPYHSAGQLAEAACYYAYPNDAKADALFPRDWADVWAKRERKDRQRQLVVAAALIVAELDRRAALEGNEEHTIRDCYNALRDRNPKLERLLAKAKTLAEWWRWYMEDTYSREMPYKENAEFLGYLADLSPETPKPSESDAMSIGDDK